MSGNTFRRQRRRFITVAAGRRGLKLGVGLAPTILVLTFQTAFRSPGLGGALDIVVTVGFLYRYWYCREPWLRVSSSGADAIRRWPISDGTPYQGLQSLVSEPFWEAYVPAGSYRLSLENSCIGNNADAARNDAAATTFITTSPPTNDVACEKDLAMRKRFMKPWPPVRLSSSPKGSSPAWTHIWSRCSSSVSSCC